MFPRSLQASLKTCESFFPQLHCFCRWCSKPLWGRIVHITACIIPSGFFKRGWCIIKWKVRISGDICSLCEEAIQGLLIIVVALIGASKQKNRHIKLLFGVCIHAAALFVWCINIIKYRMKHSCHIIASLIPAMCWYYFFYRDTVIAAQFIGGHQSLCSLCKTAERLSAAFYLLLSQLPLQDGSGISATQQNVWACHIVKFICWYSDAVQTWIPHNYIKRSALHQK